MNKNTDGPVINDLQGYTCREVCSSFDKSIGCIFCLNKTPVDCPEMLREYTMAVKRNNRPRVKPKKETGYGA